jgi:hypothetical protein
VGDTREVKQGYRVQVASVMLPYTSVWLHRAPVPSSLETRGFLLCKDCSFL